MNHNTKEGGYVRRKTELRVANRHKEGEIDTETFEELMGLLDEGKTDLVRVALLDENYNNIGDDKVKPDPLNLTWEEAEVLDEYLTTNTGSLDSVEKIKILESVHDKVRDVRQ